jgi:hypothetical protein
MSAQAYRDLIQAVEAGQEPTADQVWCALSTEDQKELNLCALKLVPAYKGSLDAAKALHEALLPDHKWFVEHEGSFASENYFSAVWQSGGSGIYRRSTSPARAWLLAILKTKLAMLGDDQ